MWFCLLLCCHYSFAEVLLGACYGGRDKTTGTPLGAPFERSKLTMGMVYVITVLQGLWCLGAIVVALPLALVFFPVVLLVAFVAPFACTFMLQKLIGPFEAWWKVQFIEGAMEDRKSVV